MAHGGSRPGAGRPKGSGTRKMAPRDVSREAAKANKTPLEFMLEVMNDAAEDMKLRSQMAVAAAPYVHEKPGEAAKGKKEQRQEAAERAASKFAVPQAPKLVVSNG